MSGIYSDLGWGSTGNGRGMKIRVDSDLSLNGWAAIRSDARGWGNAASITVDVGNKLSIVGPSEIASRDQVGGNAGAIKVSARSMELDGWGIFDAGIFSEAVYGSTRGNAGDIAVTVTDGITMRGRGRVETHTASVGNAGRVDIHARSILLDATDGPGSTGIYSDGDFFSSGNAQAIHIDVGDLTMIKGANIASISEWDGNAGTIDINAASITMKGLGEYTPIKTTVGRYSTGDAGKITIDVAGTLTIESIAEISSNTFGPGVAGSLDVRANTLVIDGKGYATGLFSSASAESSGQTGTIRVVAPGGVTMSNRAHINIGNHSSLLYSLPIEAGSISVISPNISVSSGSQITAETTGAARASKVILMPTAEGTGNMSIGGDGKGSINSSTRLFTAQELADSQLDKLQPGAGTGAAGDVEIRASNLTLSNVNVVSEAKDGTTGAAGKVTLTVPGNLSVLNNTRVATDTAGAGPAGDVIISAGNLLVDPSEISSKATAGSSGQTGNVHVSATGAVTIADGSRLSIQNDAHAVQPSSLTPSAITVNAPQINLLSGQISAASSGNVAASNVQVDASAGIVMRNAAIVTSAQDGNGGNIRLDSGRTILLDHSRVTTSVLGEQNGNAGDISVSARALAMNNAFIQANTEAPRARGGNVLINVGALVSSGVTLVGSNTPLDPSATGINVIQAAAPEGVSGNVQIGAPALDIAGSLRALSTEVISTAAVGKDLCRVGASSSLTPLGRGGLRPTVAGLIRPEIRPEPSSSPHAELQRRDVVSARADTSQRNAYRCEY
jgi:hypothetical protein